MHDTGFVFSAGSDLTTLWQCYLLPSSPFLPPLLSLSQQHTHCLLIPVESPEGHTGEMLPIGTITLVIPAAVRALGQLLDISHQTQFKG